ncbi:hypothetical protein C8R46DRAFT_493166 [Mycena filopes]|nr:hypothetical protein C8R46DRAFT_493166 [Mycena filopes]
MMVELLKVLFLCIAILGFILCGRSPQTSYPQQVGQHATGSDLQPNPSYGCTRLVLHLESVDVELRASRTPLSPRTSKVQRRETRFKPDPRSGVAVQAGSFILGRCCMLQGKPEVVNALAFAVSTSRGPQVPNIVRIQSTRAYIRAKYAVGFL